MADNGSLPPTSVNGNNNSTTKYHLADMELSLILKVLSNVCALLIFWSVKDVSPDKRFLL